MVGLAPKWVRLDPKWDKSWTFSDQISVHLARAKRTIPGSTPSRLPAPPRQTLSYWAILSFRPPLTSPPESEFLDKNYVIIERNVEIFIYFTDTGFLFYNGVNIQNLFCSHYVSEINDVVKLFYFYCFDVALFCDEFCQISNVLCLLIGVIIL